MKKVKQQIVNSKDTGVELMRILGCLIVIACHCVVAYKFEGQYFFPNTFIAGLWSDGVAIFWLVAGFFFFKSNKYEKKLMNFMARRVLPALLTGIGFFYLYDWATSDVTFFDSLKHTKQEYIDLLIGENGLLKLKSPFPQSGHFWYVIVYLMVLLFFPLLHAFWKWITKKQIRENIFLMVSFCLLIINDCLLNKVLFFENWALKALLPSCIYILWGAVIYRHKEKLTKLWLGLLGATGFIGINLLRAWVLVETNSDHFTYWFSTFGLIASICIFLFCLNAAKQLKGNLTNKVICYISSFTFMIYLVHYVVKDVITYWGIKDAIREFCLPGTTFKVFGYTVLMAFTVFVFSLALVMILHYIKVGIVTLWKLCRKKKAE